MDESLITSIYFDNINDYYCQNYVIFYDQANILSAGVGNSCNISYIKEKYGPEIRIYQIKQESIVPIIERSFSTLMTDKSKNYLAKTSSLPTAKIVNYRKMICGFLMLFIGCLFILTNLFNFLNNIIYLAQNIFKAILFKCAITKGSKLIKPAKSKIKNGDLPIYTVFVPLYKEVRKLTSIIKAINKFNYPKDKLDVKFIIEADDNETAKALAVLELAPYIQIIKVPFSLPRTKPKAMNYAVSYIKGEYLCIFDAEDRPDPNQLIKALDAFNDLPKEYACVQARLGFYNANENLLTRFFSLEYSLWFDYLLKGLSFYDLPLTLGGTSNHFKVIALKDVGYWDAYNVTEDADLGIRLYAKGYKVHILDSETLEEAPITLDNWLRQRARWIKGFIQTFYVFLMQPKNNNLNLIKIFSVYIFIGFASYSFISMPWLIMVLLFQLNKYIYYLWAINTILSLSYMYSSAYYIIKQKHFMYVSYVVVLLLWPLYSVLHTIAAYIAIFEIFTTPFKWNKTQHGVSASELD